MLTIATLAEIPVPSEFCFIDANTSNSVLALDNLETQYDVQMGLNLEADDMLQAKQNVVLILSNSVAEL